MKRDNAIDFLRGFATIWIIFIHTCFWSGEAYVPLWLRSLSLFIDVPLFMFISGMTFNINKNFFKSLKGLIKIWKKWLLFLIVYFIIVLCFDTKNFDIYSIIKAMFFHFDNVSILPVVNGSLWFVFMFFLVSIIGNLLICLYNKYFKTLDNFKYVLLLLFILYGMSLFDSSFLMVSPKIIMYILIYLLGYYLYNFKLKLSSFLSILGINIVITIILFHFSNYGFFELQEAKTISHLSYFFYTMNAIIIAAYLKDKIKITSKNILCFVGVNALMFYFCQGIGSSLIYYIYPLIEALPGLIKLILMFSSNVVITLILSCLLVFIDKKISNFKLNKIFIK